MTTTHPPINGHRFLIALLTLLLALASGPAAAALPAGLSNLFGGSGANGGDILPPEQAFQAQVQVLDVATLVADFKLAEHHYLYRDKVTFTVQSGAAKIEQVRLPPGKPKTDPYLGNTEVYHGPFQVIIKLAGGQQAAPLTLQASYQGCNEERGICFPPVQKTFKLVLAGQPLPSTGAVVGATSSSAPASTDNNDSHFADLLKNGSLWLILVSFLGFGLALAFTPCMLPMIPILSSIIAGQGAHHSRWHSFSLSLAYVLGMAITYSLAGVAAGLSGAMLASSLQNPWVLGGFALVFVALAFSMFGFYEIKLPDFLESRVVNLSNTLPGGKYSGVFVMGALSALIVSPCVAAPLAGALLYIGQTHNVVLGGSALFAMAMGMGVPLLLVGASAGTLLPKTGPWMESVKKFFGAVLLAVAIWVASPVIPVFVQMLLWAALLIVSAIFLRAIDPLPPHVGGFVRLWKGVGFIALVAGVAMLVGAFSGSRDLLQPLAGIRNAGAVSGPALLAHAKFERVNSMAELESRLASANKPVMLDFYADWCVSCKEMEQFTFTDPRVQSRFQDMLVLQADVTGNTAEHQALLRRFGLFGPPGIIFFNPDGSELKTPRVIGYQTADKFLVHLDQVVPPRARTALASP